MSKAETLEAINAAEQITQNALQALHEKTGLLPQAVNFECVDVSEFDRPDRRVLVSSVLIVSII